MTKRRLAGLTVGVVALLAISACNPAAGQANIVTNGAINAEAGGPTVTCTRSGTTVTATWQGSLGGRSTVVKVSLRRSDGWSTAAVSQPGDARSAVGPNYTTADPDGTLHWDRVVGVTHGDARDLHLTAALRCP